MADLHLQISPIPSTDLDGNGGNSDRVHFVILRLTDAPAKLSGPQSLNGGERPLYSRFFDLILVS